MKDTTQPDTETMTLRDQFALHIFNGLVAQQVIGSMYKSKTMFCYRWADAMIASRQASIELAERRAAELLERRGTS